MAANQGISASHNDLPPGRAWTKDGGDMGPAMEARICKVSASEEHRLGVAVLARRFGIQIEAVRKALQRNGLWLDYLAAQKRECDEWDAMFAWSQGPSRWGAARRARAARWAGRAAK